MKYALPELLKKVSHMNYSTVQAWKFPHISRFITEMHKKTIYRKVFWINFLCGFLVVGISYVGFQDIKSYQELQEVRNAREQVSAEVHYWEQVVKKYPSYRDGYFMLASLNAQLGNTNKAREYTDKVLQLDPDFSEGKELQETLD